MRFSLLPRCGKGTFQLQADASPESEERSCHFSWRNGALKETLRKLQGAEGLEEGELLDLHWESWKSCPYGYALGMGMEETGSRGLSWSEGRYPPVSLPIVHVLPAS